MTVSSFANRDDVVRSLRDLSMMKADDELNTITTFRNVLGAVVDLGLLSKEALCKRFVISLGGLNMWMGRDEDGQVYDPESVSRPYIYKLILEEIEVIFAA